MPGPLDVVLAPVRLAQRVATALDDLTALADRARLDPDPVEQARERVDLALAEIQALRAVARELHVGCGELTAAARQLTAAAVTLTRTADGLDRTGSALTGEAHELVTGGRELTETAKSLDTSMLAFRAALPRLLEGLDTVEELEGVVETVAETVEPLAGAAAGVGRVTSKLSRRGS